MKVKGVKMEIKSAAKVYKVNYKKSPDFLNDLFQIENAFFVSDGKVYDIYKKSFLKHFPKTNSLLIDAVEENKTIETALNICEKMTALSAKRNATLISIGGGIIQDITGFAANVLYRGVNWIFIPTTLLAACDSCIGGKTSLNFKRYKNLLGTFFPPDEINICPSFFDSLSEKDYLSGLGEVVKFNIMSGKEGLDRISRDLINLIDRNGTDYKKVLDAYIDRSLEFKKAFIEYDEFDRGERVKLNFAHTFGHAFETISNYKIPHGTAVAIGMIVANHISLERGWLTNVQVGQMENILQKIIKVDSTCILTNKENFMAAIKKDKKQISNNLTAVLLHEDMSLEVVHDLREEEVIIAIEYVQNLLKQ